MTTLQHHTVHHTPAADERRAIQSIAAGWIQLTVRIVHRPAETTNGEPVVTVTLSINEAAARCRVSTETIRRRIKRGHLPNAACDASGWRIPLQDLIAAGFAPCSPDAVAASARNTDGPSDSLSVLLDAKRQHIEALERLVAVQQQYIADLRGRQTRGEVTL